MNLKKFVKLLCPPILIPVLQRAKKLVSFNSSKTAEQDLGVYWDPEFAEVLDTWGEGNVWHEIKLLMAGRKGKVLDIACGTGKTMGILSVFNNLELYGCDISELLLSKAAEKHAISTDRLRACDATQLPYADDEFAYAYSIGSLEHFTEEGIVKFLSECHRTVSHVSFHQHPVSRNGQNEGWITMTQSYHNNSIDWWLEKYESVYETVYILDSIWEDELSLGKWFVCEKRL